MKKILILALALVLLVGIVAHGTFGLFSDAETSEGNTFTAWVEECVCEKFNVSDKPDAKIYKYDDSGAFVGSFDLSGGNGFPTGVAAVGTNVYVLDQSGKQVYRYGCCGGTPVVSRTLLRQTPPTASLGNPAGLAIDSDVDAMWVVDYGPDAIFRYLLSGAFSGSGNISALQTIALHDDNGLATGLAIDTVNNYLYVVDGADNKLYWYTTAGSFLDVSKELRDKSGVALITPKGAMFDGTWLWVVDSGTNKMYQYDMTNLFPDGGTINAASEFPLHTDNADATNDNGDASGV